MWPSGFVVVPGPLPASGLGKIYDRAVASAEPDDVRVGSTTTRVSNILRYAPEFAVLTQFGPVLSAAHDLIRRPFALSTVLARTVHPNAPAQRMHVDYASDAEGWPMLGFVLMIDHFTAENGATCFAGEQLENSVISATGPAGSMILYNGSVLHGHGANRTSHPRRSIQGAFTRA